MITRQQVLDMALALPGATSDKPFEGDFDSTVLRHVRTGRWFGLLMKVPRRRLGLSGGDEADVLNLKCDPLVSYGLRQAHPEILPAYHMNKHLWITVVLNGCLPPDILQTLVQMSYDLTARKPSSRESAARRGKAAE